MKKYLALLGICTLVLVPIGCKKNSPVLTPIQQVGCDIETAVTQTFATGVASALSCTNTAQIQSDLQAAFGNANLCSTPIPSSGSTPQLVGANGLDSSWHKIGDVPASALKKTPGGPGLAPKSVKPQGVIGNIACPIAVSTALGFLTNSVPSGWSCSTSASASTLSQTLITLCEAAIPI